MAPSLVVAEERADRAQGHADRARLTDRTGVAELGTDERDRLLAVRRVEHQRERRAPRHRVRVAGAQRIEDLPGVAQICDRRDAVARDEPQSATHL